MTSLSEFEILRKVQLACDALNRRALLAEIAKVDPAHAISARLSDDQAILDEAVQHLMDGNDLGFDWYDLPQPTRSLLNRYVPFRAQQDLDRVRAVLELHIADTARCRECRKPNPCPTLRALANGGDEG